MAASQLQSEDPSLAVHLDFENFTSTDWSLRNTAVSSGVVPDAIIVGCSRAEGRWRKNQALEFQTVNDRVRLVVPGESDASTLSAWATATAAAPPTVPPAASASATGVVRIKAGLFEPLLS